MTKKKRTPAQKLAREIQAETGKPYRECLIEARRRVAAQEELRSRTGEHQ
ncbi:hypothetical protein [Streptomyces sp. LNU-CPARS28]